MTAKYWTVEWVDSALPGGGSGCWLRILSPGGARIEIPHSDELVFSPLPHAGIGADGNFCSMGKLAIEGVQIELPWHIVHQLNWDSQQDVIPLAKEPSAQPDQETELLQRLSDRGVRADIAGEALRHMLHRLVTSPDVVTFAGHSLVLRQGENETLRPVKDIIQDLAVIREQRTALEFAAAAKELFGAEPLPAIFSLVNSAMAQTETGEASAEGCAAAEPEEPSAPEDEPL